MKKYLLVIPVIILTFTLVGCSSSSEENDSKDTSNDNKQSQNSANHNYKIPKYILIKQLKIRKFLKTRLKRY